MHWIDLSIMGAYTFGIVAIGIVARGREENASDYFIAGGTLNLHR
jgi:Na+/proline symporter